MGFFSAAANAANKPSAGRDKDIYPASNMYANINANASTRPGRYPDINSLTKPSMGYKPTQTPITTPGCYANPAYQQQYHHQQQQGKQGKQGKLTFSSLIPTNKAAALQESKMAKPALNKLGRISEKGRQYKAQKEHDNWTVEQGLEVKESKMRKILHPKHHGWVPDDEY